MGNCARVAGLCLPLVVSAGPEFAGVIETGLSFVTVDGQSFWNDPSAPDRSTSGKVGGDASIRYSVGVADGSVSARRRPPRRRPRSVVW